jgi:hypothetical protein
VERSSTCRLAARPTGLHARGCSTMMCRS